MNGSVQTAIQAISARIADMKARCSSLENATFSSTEDWGRALSELVDLQIRQAALEARKAMLETYGDLLESTPASSGRARAAWTLSTDGHADTPEPFADPDTYNAGRVNAAVDANLANLPTDVFTDLYLVNELEYLPLLEAGLSDQSTGFVGKAAADLAEKLRMLEK